METEPIIAVVGATGTGLVYVVDRFPEDGETLVTDTLRIVPGGKATNHAVGIARLGGRSRLLSALGDDPLAAVSRSLWAREGVDADGVVELAGLPSLTGSVIVDAEAANRIVIGVGAMGAFTGDLVRSSADRITSASMCLASLEMPAEPAIAAFEVARAAGVTTVLNPAPAPAEEDVTHLLPLSDWVTPNQGEATAMAGVASPGDAARRLRALGAGNVAITLGGDGVLLLTDDGEEHLPAMRVDDVVDTSGAGDAFNTAFALWLARGAAPRDAARAGIVAGGLIVQGPNFCDSLELLDRVPAVLASGVS